MKINKSKIEEINKAGASRDKFDIHGGIQEYVIVFPAAEPGSEAQSVNEFQS